MKMKYILLICSLGVQTLLAEPDGRMDSIVVNDLYNAVNWIRPQSLQLSIEENQKNPSYDKIASLKDLDSLKQLVDKGFKGLLQYDKTAIENA